VSLGDESVKVEGGHRMNGGCTAGGKEREKRSQWCSQ